MTKSLESTFTSTINGLTVPYTQGTNAAIRTADNAVSVRVRHLSLWIFSSSEADVEGPSRGRERAFADSFTRALEGQWWRHTPRFAVGKTECMVYFRGILP